MARKRLTFDQAEIRGSTAKNPKRFASRKRAPDAGGELGEPPAHLPDDQRDIWYEVVDLIPGGVAGKADSILVEMAVHLVWELRQAPTEMSSSRLALMKGCLSDLGMTPQVRAKVHFPARDEEEVEDEWSQFDPIAKRRSSMRPM